MELQTTKLPGSRLDLTFKLDTQDVKNTFASVYDEFAREAAVPGFRPGKAPASVIKRRYKAEIIRSAFWMKAVEKFVQPELEKEELEVLGDPEFPELDDLEVTEDQPVDLTITVTVRPEPELPEYAGQKLYRQEATVTDEQVAEVLEQMREAAGTVVPVEDRDVVQKGDLVEANVQFVLEGVEEPEPGSDQELQIGSGRYTPAIDEAMVDHKVGDVVELEREFPEDDPNEEMAGKKGVVKATINAIKQKVLPDLDDEFAKSQGEYEGLEDLQQKTREDLERKAADESRQALENDAIGNIMREAKVELPEMLVHQMAQRNVNNLQEELRESGMSLQDFMSVVNIDEDTLAQREHVRAALAVKLELVTDAVAKAEGVEVDEAAIEEEIDLFAAENNLEADFVRQSLELHPDFEEQLNSRAERRLTVAAVLAKADIEDVSRERYQEIREEERQAAEEKAKAEAEEAAAEVEAEEQPEAEAVEEAEVVEEAEETETDEPAAATEE